MGPISRDTAFFMAKVAYAAQNKDVARKFNRIPFKKINPYTAECEYFAGCVLSGCAPALNGPENALAIADVTDKAYRSYKEKAVL